MLRTPRLEPGSDTPLYRQLYDFIRSEIANGALEHGERLPATRELSVQIGLNRTTVSAAYALLESEGLLRGHVGRGSFVYRPQSAASTAPDDSLVSFASSRPSQSDFPVQEFQATVREVLGSSEIPDVLQLGCPAGYAPLRRYLLETARAEGVAGDDDDVLVTSGCQQALDILQRVVAPMGSAVAIEDPVYHGQKNVFTRAGVQLVPMPVGEEGAAPPAEAVAAVVVTPNFQNPTGTTMTVSARERLLARARSAVVIENDTYGPLRYVGAPLPTLKQLDRSGRVVLVRSFSKIAFPGLRVGWIIGPRDLISLLADAKQWCDLHTDQLSQAVVLRFAATGRLEEHLHRVRESGLARVQAVVDACTRHLPRGAEWTHPEGGMNLWLRLPPPLDAAALLPAAEREGVTYLAGSHFSVAHVDVRALRLSFGALSPERIELGMERLGRVCRAALRGSASASLEAAPAVV